MKVSKEKSFSVPVGAFAVSPSNEGYTLNYSADGVSFTAYEQATPANETLVCSGFANGMIYKLVGNDSDVYVQY